MSLALSLESPAIKEPPHEVEPAEN